MATCPNCGNGLDDRANFCPACGKPLGSRLSTQEFRIVTVVFCNVVRSTDLERELGDAERLAREAVYLAGKTDQLDSRAEAHVDLAEVLLLEGRGREAEHELERAISLYQEKGNEVSERHARRVLARTRS